MIDQTLYNRIAPVASRESRYRASVSLAMIWLTAAAVGLGLWWLKAMVGWHSIYATVGWLILTGVASGIVVALAGRRDEEFSGTARRIESTFPELDSALLTAIEQQPHTPHGRLGFLQQDVVRKAVYHGYQNSWPSAIPRGRHAAVRLAGAAGLIVLAVAVFGQYFAIPFDPMAGKVAFDDVVITNDDLRVTVEPGDAEVERGQSLLVLARFPGSLPPEVSLVVAGADGVEKLITMTRSLDDPVYGGRISNITQRMTYSVLYAGQESPHYQINVFEYPRLDRLDIKVEYPEYTGMAPRIVQDATRITVVEGSTLTLFANVNKPLKRARLLGKEGEEVVLQNDAVDARLLTTELIALKSKKYSVHLEDNQGRTNVSPPTVYINVQSNQRPELTQKSPMHDLQVSPLEEVMMSASVWDDFGVQRAGLNYTIAGQAEREVILAEQVAAKTRSAVGQLLAFEDLEVQPDQLVTFYFWAEDLAADGAVRRTSGDMYFAEVRRFEEIFREGQSPPGGSQQPNQNMQGGQNAQQAMELAELQKQIINATWKILRRELLDEPTEQFPDDIELLIESQSAAIEQLQALAGQIQDDESQIFVEQARSHMKDVIEQLNRALSESSIEPVHSALASEQAAYQSLLKLRAKESQVAQSNQQQGGGGGGSSRAQRQLNQLQLRNDQNRYEAQQLASAPETNEQRENRQILSRLRELARRQNDLNKRIKELQSALEEAETSEEKEEIEQRLKRLREQQEQILRDTEELQERMQQPENQSRMSQEAQQLEQVRENIQQSTEALSEGEVSRAAAEGTRAERELKDLRDEFQKRTSGQFNDAVRQMRREAREIEAQQQEISEELREFDTAQSQERSLEEQDQRQELVDQLEQQRQRVEQLRQSMRDTIEKAEEFEPILAQELYDTYRQTQQQSPEQALESTQRSLQRGFLNDARREERRAGTAIRELREGLERAANNVLGDETEALRRASQELRRLTREVQQELNQANPQSDDPESNSDSNQTDRENADRQTREQETRDEQTDSQNPDSQQSNSQAANDDRQGNQSNPGQANPSGQEDQPAQSGTGQQTDSQDSPESRGSRPGDRSADNPNDNSNSQPPNNRRGGQPSSRANNRNPADWDQQGGLGADPDPRWLADPFNFEDPSSQSPEDRSVRPIEGDDFLDWSDRLRDVEEMIADPELRADAAGIRDSAKAIRKDVRRHSEAPNWDLVKLKVVEPLVELQARVVEELLRRSSRKSMVPIDRDPVPAEFERAVKQYYEQLGRGQ